MIETVFFVWKWGSFQNCNLLSYLPIETFRSRKKVRGSYAYKKNNFDSRCFDSEKSLPNFFDTASSHQPNNIQGDSRKNIENVKLACSLPFSNYLHFVDYHSTIENTMKNSTVCKRIYLLAQTENTATQPSWIKPPKLLSPVYLPI